jgi:hypothetical protein
MFASVQYKSVEEIINHGLTMQPISSTPSSSSRIPNMDSLSLQGNSSAVLNSSEPRADSSHLPVGPYRCPQIQQLFHQQQPLCYPNYGSQQSFSSQATTTNVHNSPIGLSQLDFHVTAQRQAEIMQAMKQLSGGLALVEKSQTLLVQKLESMENRVDAVMDYLKASAKRGGECTGQPSTAGNENSAVSNSAKKRVADKVENSAVDNKKVKFKSHKGQNKRTSTTKSVLNTSEAVSEGEADDESGIAEAPDSDRELPLGDTLLFDEENPFEAFLKQKFKQRYNDCNDCNKDNTELRVHPPHNEDHKVDNADVIDKDCESCEDINVSDYLKRKFAQISPDEETSNHQAFKQVKIAQNAQITAMVVSPTQTDASSVLTGPIVCTYDDRALSAMEAANKSLHGLQELMENSDLF